MPVTVPPQEVSYRKLETFLQHDLQVHRAIRIDKERGLLTVRGGCGLTVDVLPADESSQQAAICESVSRIQFPLMEGALVLESSAGSLRVEMTLSGFLVQGQTTEAVAAALGVTGNRRVHEVA